MKQSRSSAQLVRMIVLALLAAMSVVLMFISFPILPVYPYLKVDFSDVPAIIAALVFSPPVGIVVLLFKCVLYYLVSGATDPIGVAANFIAGTILILPIAFLYRKYKNVGSIILGFVIGITLMSLAMSVLNYYVVLPAYSWLLGWEMTPAVIKTTVVAGVLPFNLLKGVIVGALFIPLFSSLRVWIEDKQKKFA